MIVLCPHCGKSIIVSGLGRKPLNRPLKNICDALRAHQSVAAAARELDCSPAYVFKVLKASGLRPTDVIEGKSASGG